jgi:predicted MFS family arabinose efflux permease
MIPSRGIALLEALRLSGADSGALGRLDHSEWQRLLQVCDATQLTLLTGHLGRPSLPDWVRARIDRNYLDNAYRFERLKEAVFEISDCLARRSIDFCLLKGFTHAPDFTPDPLLRSQGDIDIWCLPERVLEAQDALLGLGYRPFGKSKGRHLDPMIRETKWEWRGDYFARDLPIPVDLHFSLWDQQLERIPGPHEDRVWSRRSLLAIEGHSIPILDSADALTFAALHLMMHLLHGDLRLQRAWELAYFLQNRLHDDEFWQGWHGLHPDETSQLQVIAFALSGQWFGCQLPPLIAKEVDSLPEDVSLWLRKYSWSPIEALFVPNKDVVWLNLCLLTSFRDKVDLLSRRLLPMQTAINDGLRLRSAFLLRRCVYHSRTLPLTCIRGLQWWWLRQGLGRDFLKFQLASALFDFGEFVFFLLYNLYLLECGYDEQFIGQVAAAMTAGTFLGVIPAAAVTQRAGLRNAVMMAILGAAAATSLRAFVVWRPALLASAFLSGVFLSFWAVSLPPAIANLTNSRNRTLGFSLVTSIGIGAGAFGGFLGGRLPMLLVKLNPSLTSIGSKRIALLAGSAFAALAIVPAARLRFSSLPAIETDKKKYPNSPFVYAFLLALFIWTIGTGGFNPFFNVYFSRYLHVTVAHIGLIFSYGQVSQLLAIPLAPAIVRKMGEVRGITGMQLATAVTLGLLAFVSNPLPGALLYIAYVSFQYMSEPCLLSMLMTRVHRSERSGASALNFLVMSLAGIFAATIAGAMVPRVGYGPILAICAAVITVAATLFYSLLIRDL